MAEQSPPSAEKPKNQREKRQKALALKEFLGAAEQQVEVKPPSDSEQLNVQLGSQCRVCFQTVPDARRICGFCKQQACADHLRKRRKFEGKFVRICDDCEDKHLYNKYSKLQQKTEEGLAAEEMVIGTKHKELAQTVAGKRTKLTMLTNKRALLEEEQKRTLTRYSSTANQLATQEKKLEGKKQQLEVLQAEVDKLVKTIPRSLEEDLKMLIEEDDKITKELVRLNKECAFVIQQKSNREKEIYEKYYQWEATQVKRKQKEDCAIF